MQFKQYVRLSQIKTLTVLESVGHARFQPAAIIQKGAVFGAQVFQQDVGAVAVKPDSAVAPADAAAGRSDDEVTVLGVAADDDGRRG